MHPADQSAETLYYAALDHIAEGRAEEAVQGFSAALARDPGFLDAWHGLIRALQDAGCYDQALAEAHALAAQAPQDVLAQTAISILYQRKGMIPEAEEAATRAKLLGWKLELRAAVERKQEL